MTKKEFAKTIADELGLPQQLVKTIVQRVLDSIAETLATDGVVELRKFGVFKLKIRRSRKVRNPQTGEEFIAPDKTLIQFKPGSSMIAKVDEFERWRAADKQRSSARKITPISTSARPTPQKKKKS